MHIEQLEESIKHAKRLRAALDQNISEINCMIRAIKAKSPKRPKSKNSN